MATSGISKIQAAVSALMAIQTIVAFRIVVFHKRRKSQSLPG